jgi:magnesium transporter
MTATKKHANRRRRGPHVRRRTPPGSPPGTLVADPSAAPPRMRVMAYGPEGLHEAALASPQPLDTLVERHAVTWVDVQGLGDVPAIEALGRRFGLHALALEDVLNVHQRPKLEAYEDHLFIVARMPEADGAFTTEQISFFVGRDFVLTFQEHDGDCLEPVRQRLRSGPGRMRSSGPDYLLYALLDAILDAYFPVLERYGESVEQLEDAVLEHPGAAIAARIHELKRDLLALRRVVWPMREVLNALSRGDAALVTPQTGVYLRDCYDHIIQLMDMIETYREIASGLIDIHLSSQSARMNEVIKVLTIIATIFIPLGTIAGIYGMNFDPDISPWNMPELRWRYGYFFALGIMLAMASGLMLWFWRRGWLMTRRPRTPRAGARHAR